jgi:DHA3 family macrolide efflux protein-like MFS transporter
MRNVEGTFIGRVSGAITPIFMGMMVIGMLVSGLLKDSISLVAVYALSGGLLIVGALLLAPLFVASERKIKMPTNG